MTHLSLSQSFLIPVPKLAVRLQLASPLSPPFSPPPQHLASLQPTIILTLIIYTSIVVVLLLYAGHPTCVVHARLNLLIY